MKTADIASSALVALFALALLFVVIPIWVPVEEGPEFGLAATSMPYVAAATTLALSVLFLAYRSRDRHARSDAEAEADRVAPIDRRNWLFLFRGGLFLIAMAALFEWLGFLAAGPPTVAGFMVLMGERRPVPMAATAIVTTAAIWLFFWQFLKFPLP